jgi:hypothetical protein
MAGRGGYRGEPPKGHEDRKEQEQPPYYQAARFEGEHSAGRAYTQAQEVTYRDEACDLSAYRLQLSRVWHVAVLGAVSSKETDAVLGQILSEGQLVPLPDQLLNLLQERRTQATQHGSWVEGHYRPGKKLGY